MLVCVCVCVCVRACVCMYACVCVCACASACDSRPRHSLGVVRVAAARPISSAVPTHSANHANVLRVAVLLVFALVHC